MLVSVLNIRAKLNQISHIDVNQFSILVRLMTAWWSFMSNSFVQSDLRARKTLRWFQRGKHDYMNYWIM